ncbi:MAG: HDOD domain-containing protein [Burkholderiaceae bacterium]|nr:HDOD domain-containing protein [Burkholderiaceae bacterium]
MPVLLLSIVVAVAVAALVWWKFFHPSRRAPAPLPLSRASMPSRKRRTAPSTVLHGTVSTFPTPAGSAPSMPVELSMFHWMRSRDLASTRRHGLMAAIKGIPRPPQSLQQLLSPGFFSRASLPELSELVMAEPLIAAKILAAVNAPFYGLHQPVTSIEPAVTMLGMDTVRSICLQYMLAQAFKPELAASQQSFDAIWRASAIASELAVRLGKSLNLPDQGGIATKVVLVFVGHLAAASLMPHNAVNEWLVLDRLRRAQLEQEVMGLPAGEIGGLLLRLWKLPASLVRDVSATSRVLVTPVAEAEPDQVPRLGLSYLCVRLGERLALGQLVSLESYDTAADISADTFYLREYLEHPALIHLNDTLRSTELRAAVQQMMGKNALLPHHPPLRPSTSLAT